MSALLRSVYDKQGHIITNNQMVGGAKVVDVTFIDGNRYAAKVTGSDTYNDIALYKFHRMLVNPRIYYLLLGC